MTENAMNAKVVKTLNEEPRLKAIKLHGNQYQSAIADILVFYYGHSLLLEGKAKGKKQTKIQAAVAKTIEKKGGVRTVVFYSHDEALSIVTSWRKTVDGEIHGR